MVKKSPTIPKHDREKILKDVQSIIRDLSLDEKDILDGKLPPLDQDQEETRNHEAASI